MSALAMVGQDFGEFCPLRERGFRGGVEQGSRDSAETLFGARRRESDDWPRWRKAMHHMSRAMQDCINECLTCYQVCLGTAMTHCLEAGGEHTKPAHFRLISACAEICRTSAHFMLLNSPHHRHVCGECAEICEQCAKDCERIGDMQDCVEACRRCAKSCRAMASHKQAA
jgi:ferredoxin